jgi:hypothetical protein
MTAVGSIVGNLVSFAPGYTFLCVALIVIMAAILLLGRLDRN